MVIRSPISGDFHREDDDHQAIVHNFLMANFSREDQDRWHMIHTMSHFGSSRVGRIEPSGWTYWAITKRTNPRSLAWRWVEQSPPTPTRVGASSCLRQQASRWRPAFRRAWRLLSTSHSHCVTLKATFMKGELATDARAKSIPSTPARATDLWVARPSHTRMSSCSNPKF